MAEIKILSAAIIKLHEHELLDFIGEIIESTSDQVYQVVLLKDQMETEITLFRRGKSKYISIGMVE